MKRDDHEAAEPQEAADQKAADQVVRSMEDYARAIMSMAQSGDTLWYRGVADSQNHTLKPSLYRHPEILDSVGLISLEKSMLSSFQHRSPPFIEGDPDRYSKVLERMFLMQHHGVPTRLLDWSENPFVALYFAINKYRRDGCVTNPAVWVLKPKKLNEVALNGISKDNNIILPPDHEYLDAFTNEVTRTKPVALYGTHNSRRIVAQRGVFVLFGASTDPMEVQLKDERELLTKIEIDAAGVGGLI